MSKEENVLITIYCAGCSLTHQVGVTVPRGFSYIGGATTDTCPNCKKEVKHGED